MKSILKQHSRISFPCLFAALALGAGLSMADAPPPAPEKSLANAFNAAAERLDIDGLAQGAIIHLESGHAVSKEQMMEDVAHARVIYVSELHDNLAAHEAQLDIIRALEEKFPGRIAVGMEMFRESTQPALDAVHDGRLSRQDFNRLFDQDWTPDWRPAYQPILDYMHEHAIPVIGLKPSKDIEAIVRSGQTSPDVPEMDENDPHHKSYYTPFFGGHSTGPQAQKMYRMMVLWDEAMANNVARFLANPDNRDKKLVVIAGEGHIRYGFGIPKRAQRRIPHASATVLPMIGNDPETSVPLRMGDYVWKVPYDRLEVESTPQPLKAPSRAP